MLLYLGILAVGAALLALWMHHKQNEIAAHKHLLVAAVGGAVLVVPLAQLSTLEKQRLELEFETAGQTVVVAPPDTLATAAAPSDGEVQAAQVVKKELESDGYTVDLVDASSDAAKKSASPEVLQVTGVNGITTALDKAGDQ
jgi:hypothetical protein